MVGPRVPWVDRGSSGACRRPRAHAALPALSGVAPEPPSGTRAMGAAAAFVGDKQKFPVSSLPRLHRIGFSSVSLLGAVGAPGKDQDDPQPMSCLGSCPEVNGLLQSSSVFLLCPEQAVSEVLPVVSVVVPVPVSGPFDMAVSVQRSCKPPGSERCGQGPRCVLEAVSRCALFPFTSLADITISPEDTPPPPPWLLEPPLEEQHWFPPWGSPARVGSGASCGCAGTAVPWLHLLGR